LRKREKFLDEINEQEKDLEESQRIQYDSQVELLRTAIESGKGDSILETTFKLKDYLVILGYNFHSSYSCR
jgi:hypothetical protein